MRGFIFSAHLFSISLFLIAQNLFSQEQRGASEQMFTIYTGPGIAIPVGSFNAASKKSNDFKAGPAFNYKGGFEWYVDNENCVSLDGDVNLFLNTRNESLNQLIDNRVKSTGKNYLYEEGTGEISIYNFCVGYSRVIPIDQFLLQPKLNVGLGNVEYDFSASYIEKGSTGFVLTSTGNISRISYSGADMHFFVVKPEISLKYAKRSEDKIKWMLSFTLGYYYLHPSMPVYENFNGNISVIKTLNGPINCLTTNVTFSLVVPKEFFRAIFRPHPSFFFF